MVLRVDNRAIVAALVIWITSVSLLSKNVLVLYDYLHIPNVIWNVVSIPQLVHGYTISFAYNECLIMFNNVYMGKAVMMNDLYFLKTHACEYS